MNSPEADRRILDERKNDVSALSASFLGLERRTWAIGTAVVATTAGAFLISNTQPEKSGERDTLIKFGAEDDLPKLNETELGGLGDLLEKSIRPHIERVAPSVWADLVKDGPVTAVDRIVGSVAAGGISFTSSNDLTVFAAALAQAVEVGKVRSRALRQLVSSMNSSSASEEGNTLIVNIIGEMKATPELLYLSIDYHDERVASAAIDILATGDQELRRWLQTTRAAMPPSAGTDREERMLTLLRRSQTEIEDLQRRFNEKVKEVAELRSRADRVSDLRDALDKTIAEHARDRAEDDALRNRTRREVDGEIHRLRGFGARGGIVTEDLIPEGARIRAIGCCYGDRVISIWLVYEKDGLVSETARRGGRGGQEELLHLDDDEVIKSFEHQGRSTEMAWLEVHTNKRVLNLGKERPSIRRGPLAVTVDGADLASVQRENGSGEAVCVGFRVLANDQVRCVAPIVQLKR